MVIWKMEEPIFSHSLLILLFTKPDACMILGGSSPSEKNEIMFSKKTIACCVILCNPFNSKYEVIKKRKKYANDEQLSAKN